MAQASARRKRLFVGLKIPYAIELIDARVTMLCPLQLGSYGFLMTTRGIMIGQGELGRRLYEHTSNKVFNLK